MEREGDRQTDKDDLELGIPINKTTTLHPHRSAWEGRSGQVTICARVWYYVHPHSLLPSLLLFIRLSSPPVAYPLLSSLLLSFCFVLFSCLLSFPFVSSLFPSLLLCFPFPLCSSLLTALLLSSLLTAPLLSSHLSSPFLSSLPLSSPFFPFPLSLSLAPFPHSSSVSRVTTINPKTRRENVEEGKGMCKVRQEGRWRERGRGKNQKRGKKEDT